MEAVTWGSQVLRSVNKKKDEIRQLEKNLQMEPRAFCFILGFEGFCFLEETSVFGFFFFSHNRKSSFAILGSEQTVVSPSLPALLNLFKTSYSYIIFYVSQEGLPL